MVSVWHNVSVVLGYLSCACQDLMFEKSHGGSFLRYQKEVADFSCQKSAIATCRAAAGVCDILECQHS